MLNKQTLEAEIEKEYFTLQKRKYHNIFVTQFFAQLLIPMFPRVNWPYTQTCIYYVPTNRL